MVALTLSSVVKCMACYGPKLYSLLRKEKDRLGAIEIKIEQLVIREIQSAFAIVDSLATIESPAMRDRHLNQAEVDLLKNIGLDQELQLAGKRGAYWVAKCYFGLSVVAQMRNEETDSARHLLRAFQIDPRQTRLELASDFFAELFQPACADILAQRTAETAKLSEYQSRRKALEDERTWTQIKGAGLMAGASALALFGPRNQALLAVGVANREREQKASVLTNQINAIPTEYSIEREYQDQIDTRCKILSTQILDEHGLAGASS